MGIFLPKAKEGMRRENYLSSWAFVLFCSISGRLRLPLLGQFLSHGPAECLILLISRERKVWRQQLLRCGRDAHIFPVLKGHLEK
jgi:hypothetical protein